MQHPLKDTYEEYLANVNAIPNLFGLPDLKVEGQTVTPLSLEQWANLKRQLEELP